MKLLPLGSIALALFAASPALAAFTINELHTATTLAVTDFVKSNPGHSDHFTGYKSWKSGEEAKVKVYATHNGANMEFNYVCHKHPGIECHAQ